MDMPCSSQPPYLFSLICFFLCSHNLEYDSSEEKKPRLIFYNEKDEIVKVRSEYRDLLFRCLVMELIKRCQTGFMWESFDITSCDIRSSVRYQERGCT